MTRRRLASVPDELEDAVEYARVSREREEMISPQVQRAAIADYRSRHPVRVVESVQDLDQTGRNFARAGIQRIIAGVESGLWTVVLVYRYDRFGRNVRDSLVNIARVEQAGGRVVSVTEPFDASTAIGKYGRTNILAVAELQSDLIGENWKATHSHRRARGLPHAGYARLGYRYDRRDGYTIDPDTAPVVSELYRRYMAGEGYRPLATWLQSRAILSPRTGGPWTPRGVAYFLDSGFPAGLFRSAGRFLPGAHESIIDEATWKAYQRERARRGELSPRTAAATTVLAGVVRCAGCRYAMRSKSDRRYGAGYLYVCETPACPAPVTVTRQRAERTVKEWLATFAVDVDQAAAAKEATKADRALARADVTRLQREVTRLTEQLTRLTVKLAAELIADEEFTAARTELLEGRSAALAELSRAEDVEVRRAPSSKDALALLEEWDSVSINSKRVILRTLLQVVVVSRVEGHRATVRPYGVWEQLP